MTPVAVLTAPGAANPEEVESKTDGSLQKHRLSRCDPATCLTLSHRPIGGAKVGEGLEVTIRCEQGGSGLADHRGEDHVNLGHHAATAAKFVMNGSLVVRQCGFEGPDANESQQAAK